MIYEIVWNTDGINPGNLDLPKYVIVSNKNMTSRLKGEDFPDPPVFHIIPNDYPDFNPEEEIVDFLTELFDWCIDSIYIVENDAFNKDMKFFSQHKYVTYEFN